MARNVFARNPYLASLEDLHGETRSGRSPVRAAAPQAAPAAPDLGETSIRHNVPVNVLMALGEAGDAQPEAAAARLRKIMDEGHEIGDALAIHLGDLGRADALMSRAWDIADEHAPKDEAPEPKKSTAGDALNLLRGEMKRGIGLAASGVARMAENTSLAESLGFDVPDDGPIGWLASGGLARSWGERAQEKGKALAEDISEASAAAKEGATPRGDLFKPGTWQAPEDPTAAGVLLLGAEVMGSLLPVVAASVAGGPGAGLAVGGLQGAEAGAGQAREVVEAAAADGTLQRESVYYRERIAAGDSPEAALEATIDRAEGLGFLFTLPVSALGGYATSKILGGATSKVVGGNMATRVAGGAAIGAAEEGAQEVGESVASRAGAQAATGLDVDLTEDTLADFTLGALGGGPVGAVGGIRRPQEQEQEIPVVPGEDPAIVGEQTSPQVAGDGGAPQRTVTRRPRGPIEAALEGAPPPPPTDAEVAGAEEAARRFPDQKPGSEIEIRDPEGRTFTAIFLGEDEGGVRVRIHGDEVALTPAEFDEARDAARAAQEAQKQAEKAQKGQNGQNGRKLSDQALANVQPPAEAARLPGTVDETRTAIANVHAKARPQNGGLSPQDGRLLARLEAHLDELLDRQAIEGAAAPTQDVQLEVPKREPVDPAPVPTQAEPQAQVPERGGDAPAAEPIRTKSGRPFVDEKGALRALKNRGFDPDAYDLVPEGEGVVAVPKVAGDGDREGGRGEGIAEPRSEGAPQGAEDGAEAPAAVGAEGDAPQAAEADAGGVDGPAPGMVRMYHGGHDADAGGARWFTSSRSNAEGWSKQRGGAEGREDEVWFVDVPRDDPMFAADYPEQSVDQGFTVQKEFDPAVYGQVRRLASDESGRSSVEEQRSPKPRVGGSTPSARAKTPPAPMKAPDERVQPDLLGGEPKTETQMAAEERRKQSWGRLTGMIRGDRVADIEEEIDGLEIMGHGEDRLEVRRDGESLGTVEVKSSPQAIRDLQRIVDRETGRMIKVTVPMKEDQKPDPNPTEAQKDAGNYRMGHMRWNGLDISIETAKGQTRSGKSPDGTEWSVTMPADYGYVKRTEGADGDHIDVYMGPDPESDYVVIVNQVDAETGAFDEHKVILGAKTSGEALAIYRGGFSDGRANERIGSTTTLDVGAFKRWLEANPSQPTEPITFPYLRGRKGQQARKKTSQARKAPTAPTVEERTAPPGHMLGSVKKMTKAEAERSAGDPDARGKEWKAGDFLALVSRHTPYAIFGGYGKTRAEAVNDAIARAEANPAPKAEPEPNEESKVSPLEVMEDKDHVAQPSRGLRVGMEVTTDELAIGRSRIEGFFTRPTLAGDLDMAQLLVLDNPAKGRRIASPLRGLKPATQALTGAERARGEPSKADPEPEPAPSYGAKNRLVSQDRRAELAARLKAKLATEVRSGIDPEILAIGAELMVFHVEAGARAFADAIKAVAADLDMKPSDLGRYARSWYNGSRDMMEDSDVSIEGMDDADTVRGDLARLKSGELDGEPPSDKMEEAGSQEAPDEGRDNAGDGGSGAAEGEDPASRGPARTLRERGGATSAGDGGEPAPAEREGRPEPAPDAGRGGVEPGDRGSDRAGRPERARNHVIEPGDLEPKGGAKSRARQSIEAIRLLKALEAERRKPTADERKVLARYGGAGTLAPALPRTDGRSSMPDILEEMNELLTEDERKTIDRTSQYAFYTAEPVVRAMWRLAGQLGFKGGRVYEPGMGVGGFAGTVPEDLRAATRYSGLELDHITARIAQALYPESAVKQGDFTRTAIPRDHYDLVIGNPPLAATAIKADPAYPQGFFIHDYFFAKSLDAVRPGGLLMFVSSAGTMNKLDRKARDYLADRADLVGAIRLPSTAFKDFAGTEVTTDIVVLRKRAEGEAEADPSWREATTIEMPSREGGTGEGAVNRYFQARPEMILGEQGLFDTLVGRPRVGVRPTGDLTAQLAGALRALPANVMTETTAAAEMDVQDAAAPEWKPGSYYLKDGDLYQFDGHQGVKVESRTRENSKGKPKGDLERIRALVPVKMALRDVYAADLGRRDATAERKALNKAYDAFVKKFGPINKTVETARAPNRVQVEGLRQRAYDQARTAGEPFDPGSFDPAPFFERGASLSEIASARAAARARPGYREGDFDPEDVPPVISVKRPNIDPFMDDQEGYRLRAIEHYDRETGTAEKGRVFTDNAITFAPEAKITSPEDALLHVLAETGRVDLPRIAELSRSSEETVRAELGESIFRNPEAGEWETRDRYLSGNIYRKLDAAEAAARDDDEYARNVEALRAAIPTPIPPEQIRAQIGAHWFPMEVYSQWAASKGLRLDVKYREALGVWTAEGSESEAAARSEWGTDEMPFGKLMALMLNGRAIEVKTKPDKDEPPRLDEDATQAANDKAQELREDFNTWFWADEDRAAQMAESYNRLFNAEVAPEYDGSYLTTPGVHSSWRWRPHQTAVIARILQTGNTYMAHAVGAGKTSAMIGAGMEARRLGLARKPMYVVPNHMLEQFSTEFYEQYPLAKIAIADEQRFHTSRRKQFVADIQANDYDAVIITHSAFKLIPPSHAARSRVIGAQLEEIREILGDLGEGDDRVVDRALLGAMRSMAKALDVDTKEIEESEPKTRKRVEQMLEAAEQRLDAASQVRGQDQVADFDELGIDMLFVDEAHEFRKLSYFTQHSSLKGVDGEGSLKSMDLFIKTRIMEDANPGRGLVFASGTPITNTMGELFSLSRYIQPGALEERGIGSFDAWAQTFGETRSDLEPQPQGGFKNISRFAKFVNTPELSLMVRQAMDIVTSADLAKYVTRPALEGGARKNVIVERTPEFDAIQADLAVRFAAMKAMKPEERKGKHHYFSILNDGRLAAIDPRLVSPGASGEGSKLNAMIRNIHRIWKEGRNGPLYDVKPGGGYAEDPAERGPLTQMVFATLGINGSQDNPEFKVHRHIKDELVRLGVPANEVILQDDLKTAAQKQRAFTDMNDGKRTILIGGKKLFTGVNAQRRMRAIHNLDPLWYPADDEQRNGRGIRQGNRNREIAITDYTTKGSYDAQMYGLMGAKAAFIEGFYRGDPSMREMEDLGEASVFEQAKAMAVSDPRVLELADLKGERDKLERRKRSTETGRWNRQAEAKRYERAAAADRAAADTWDAIAAKVEDTAGDAFQMKIGAATLAKRKDAGEALLDAAEAALGETEAVQGRRVGTLSGFPVLLSVRRADMSAGLQLQYGGDRMSSSKWSDDPVALVRMLEASLQGAREAPGRLRAMAEESERKSAAARASLEKMEGFKQQAELDALNERITAIETDLLKEADDETVPEGARQARRDRRPAAEDVDHETLATDLRARLSEAGIADRTALRVSRMLIAPGPDGAPMRIDGYQKGRLIAVAMDAADPRATLDHEIVHMLRDPDIWGRPYGLFDQGEWRALVRTARADKARMESVRARYPDLDAAGQIEEAVAEMYADWRAGRAQPAEPSLMQKIASFLEALATVLRGGGFATAEGAMQAIARGDVGRSRDARGRFVPEAGRVPAGARLRRPDLPPFPAAAMPKPKDWTSNASDIFTTAMPATLSLVPGRPLFAELGKRIASAQAYLNLKERMDALRNDWHARTDKVSQDWLTLRQKDSEANEQLMDLMHRATLAGIDPSKPLETPPGASAATRAARRVSWGNLKAEFDALPQAHQDMFRRVAAGYDAMGDAFEAAVLENIRTAAKIGLKRAERNHLKELRRIEDEGLVGPARDDAIAAAEKRLDQARKSGGWSVRARIATLRQQFESNRLSGPYFPLARFGQFWATVRDDEGKVISFSRFETKGQQRRYLAQATAEHGAERVSHGVLGEGDSLEAQVDPKFVADVQGMLGEWGADPKLMDAVWQRWLETLPDQSIRTSRIHRKGRAGYNRDALRAFAHHMFHGAHQLARLKFGLQMQDALEDAADEAARADDPERAGLVVNEMQKRHEFTMSPTGGQLATAATSLAFVWYLGVTPAAALVNLTQTTVVGIPILGSAFERLGTATATAELGRALKDFAGGRGHIENGNLTADEKAAMEEAYRRGTIDKTQAHELASVAESGVRYSAVRERWMKRISFFFHHAERMNREITFLAAYRMARRSGLDPDMSVDKAAGLTWKTHFDYQNTARPRIMQNDWMKVLTVFRAFTVNMLWRLFRDSHQALKGATPEERREARGQLVGITLSMMAHAGIRGVWGYGLLTTLLSFFGFGEDDEDVDGWLQDALLMEGESTGVAAWNYAMGMVLNGTPGHVAGVSLTERIGMPDLWFRGSDRILEGEDLYNHWIGEVLGPVGGIAESFVRGAQYMGGGNWWRGTEAMVPKFARDVMQGVRYGANGVETRNGDPILEDVNPYQVLVEVAGFTPAQVAERYQANSRMKNREIRIGRERRDIYRAARDAILEGEPIPESVMAEIRDWNRTYPEWPITGQTIRTSVNSRRSSSARNEFGIQINPKLNQKIRGEAPPLVYN